MKKFYKLLWSPFVILILIYVLLIQGLFLPSQLQFYRFSDEYFYIYKYGKFISKSLVYIAFTLSLFYPLIIWLKEKENFRKKRILIFLGVIPALYFCLLLILPFILKIFEYSN